MERHHLVCMLIGWHTAKNPHISSDDLKLEIDNELFKAKFTPLGTEDGDLQLLEELLGETMMYVLGQGINRKQRRGN